MRDKITIPKWVLEVVSDKEAFFQRVQDTTTLHFTIKDAYEKVEADIQFYGATRQYSTYSTFRKAYYRWAVSRLNKTH